MRTAFLLALAAAVSLSAQVTSQHILNADDPPGNWLTYNGTYAGTHYSKLDRIRAQNVGDLELKWAYQTQSLEKFESTPLVVDGVMYTVEMPNNVLALDAVTGRQFWKYEHVIESFKNACCGSVNRGLAILGETLYMGTIDGKLLALDAKSGALRFSKQLVDPAGGYSLTTAPLVVKDKIVLGTAGGEYGVRGWLGAFDPKDGSELWRFNTIPAPANPAMRPGRTTPGKPAAAPSGSPAPTTPNSTSCIGASATPPPIGTPTCAPATTSTPIPSSPSIPTTAN